MNIPSLRSRHPKLLAVATICVGLIVGLLLAEAGMRVLETVSADSRQSRPPPAVTKEGSSQDIQPATEHGYQATPWYARFAGRAVSMRSHLVPFSAIPCDSRPTLDPPPCRDGNQNSHGFRVPEYTLARPPDTFRMVIVGDSYTWGDGVQMEETYHRRLQERFDGARQPGAPRVEVIGLGVNGSSIFDNVVRLLVHGQRLDPDLVVLQYLVNDLEYRSDPEELAPDRPRDALDRFLMRTALGRVLRKLRARPERSGRSKWSLEHESDRLEWAMLQSALDLIENWGRDREIPVAVLSLTIPDSSADGRNYDNFRNLGEQFEAAAKVEYEAERRGLPVLRSLDTLRERAGDRFLAVSSANAHYNPLAHELVGDGMFESLQDADWFEPGIAQARPSDARWATENALRLDAAARWADYHQSYDLQLDLFGRLAELYPEDPWIAHTLAFIHRDGRVDLEACRLSYARLLELEPQHAAPWEGLAGCTNEAEERTRLLAHMLTVVPDHVNAAAWQLAALDAKAGRRERACGCYRRVAGLALYPNLYKRALKGLQRNRCDSPGEETCPGPDPLAPL